MSALSTDSTSVSMSSPSPNAPSTVSTGEPGAYVEPSAYAETTTSGVRPVSQSRVCGRTTSRSAVMSSGS